MRLAEGGQTDTEPRHRDDNVDMREDTDLPDNPDATAPGYTPSLADLLLLDPEHFPRHLWNARTNFGLNVASVHLRQIMKADPAPRGLRWGITSVVRHGQILHCEVNAYAAQAMQTLKPGTIVKVISRADQADLDSRPASESSLKLKSKPRSSILEAEVVSLTPSDDPTANPACTLRLLERGRIFTRTGTEPSIRCKSKTKEHKAQAERIEGLKEAARPASEISRLNPPSCLSSPDKNIQKLFLEGDFPTREPTALEHLDGLDDAQNRAFGRAMAIDEQPVLFIHGGPGTGKTTTLCRIVEGHINEGRKVLVLSHSNKGADVPAVRLKNKGIKVHRAGRKASVIDPQLHEDRILRTHDSAEEATDISFPTAEIREINRLPDGDLRQRTNFRLTASTVRTKLKEDVLAKYQGAIKAARDRLHDSIRSGGIVFSTLGTLLNDEILQATKFDVVIVDEATRLRMPDLLLALEKAGKQIILVGDPLQLGNIPLDPEEKAQLIDAVIKNLLEDSFETFTKTEETPDTIRTKTVDQIKELLGETLTNDAQRDRLKVDAILKRLKNHLEGKNFDDKTLYALYRAAEMIVDMYEEGPFPTAILGSQNPEEELPYVFLNQDRRSKPAIVKVLSELIYGGKLEPGRDAPETNKGIVRWINTGTLKTEERPSGTSRCNPKEADVVTDMVLERLLNKDTAKRIAPEDIAVIATYAEQAEAIRRKLSRRLHNNPRLLARILPNVASVDAFQGDERKVVFVSLTRSNQEGKVGFLEEERRIGVAIGRAADELYMVGDVATLVERNNNPESQRFFSKMRDLIKEHGKIEDVRLKKRKRRKR